MGWSLVAVTTHHSPHKRRAAGGAGTLHHSPLTAHHSPPITHGGRTGNNRSQRAESDGLGFGTFGELGDLVRLAVGSPGQPAEHAIAGAAAAGLGRGPDFGLARPAVRRAPRHVVFVRPRAHGSALREREREPGLPLLAVFFGHSQEADVPDLAAVRLCGCVGAAQGPGGHFRRALYIQYAPLLRFR